MEQGCTWSIGIGQGLQAASNQACLEKHLYFKPIMQVKESIYIRDLRT